MTPFKCTYLRCNHHAPSRKVNLCNDGPVTVELVSSPSASSPSVTTPTPKGASASPASPAAAAGVKGALELEKNEKSLAQQPYLGGWLWQIRKLAAELVLISRDFWLSAWRTPRKLWYGWFGIGGDTAWKLTLHLRIDPYLYLQDLITELKNLEKTQHTVTLRVHFNDVLFSICQILGPVLLRVYLFKSRSPFRVQPWNSKCPTWRFVVTCCLLYPPPPRIAKWQCPTWGSFLLPKMRSSLRQCGALAKKWRDGWWTSVVEDFKKGGDKTIGKFVVAKNPWLIEGYNHTGDLSVKLHFFSLSHPQKLTAGTPKWRYI